MNKPVRDAKTGQFTPKLVTVPATIPAEPGSEQHIASLKAQHAAITAAHRLREAELKKSSHRDIQTLREQSLKSPRF